MAHPILEKIDQDSPCFSRALTWRERDKESACDLQLWLPVQMDDGVWVSAVRLTGLGFPPLSAMPGEDPLGAMLNAMSFARSVMAQKGGVFLFGDRQWESAGLPLWLDKGFEPSRLADLEAQALELRDRTFDAVRTEFGPSGRS